MSEMEDKFDNLSIVEVLQLPNNTLQETPDRRCIIANLLFVFFSFK